MKGHICRLTLIHNSAGTMPKGKISSPREMLISLPPSSGLEGPSKLQGGGICTESLVDMIGPMSAHFYNLQQRGVRYISPISVINQVSLSGGSKSKQSKHSNKNIFQDSGAFPVEKPDFQLD